MTNNNPRSSQGQRPFMRAIALAATLSVTAGAHGQPTHLPRQAPPPDPVQIQSVLRVTLLCEWPKDQTKPGFGEFEYVHRHLMKNYASRAEMGAREHDTRQGMNMLGAFEVFGTHFDEIKIAGFMGGGAGMAWSANGDKEALLAELRTLGYVFETIPAPFGGTTPALQGRLPNEAGGRAILIHDGRLESLTGPVVSGGFSLLCRPDRGD